MPDTPTHDADPNRHPDGDRIDAKNAASLQNWADKFDVSPEQIEEAVAEVGTFAPDVEMHLKGTHATTNADAAQRAKSAPGA